MRLLIVVRPAVAAKANQAALQADTAGGDRTFTVALRAKNDATNTVRAYWCSREMTPGTRTTLVNALKAQGLTSAEVAVVPATQRGSFTPDPAARAYIFAAGDNAWSSEEVASVLGIEPITPPFQS